MAADADGAAGVGIKALAAGTGGATSDASDTAGNMMEAATEAAMQLVTAGMDCTGCAHDDMDTAESGAAAAASLQFEHTTISVRLEGKCFLVTDIALLVHPTLPKGHATHSPFLLLATGRIVKAPLEPTQPASSTESINERLQQHL